MDVCGGADGLTEKLDDFAQGGGEGGDVGLGVVEVKTRAGGAGEAELFHQRHVAMVSAAQGDALLVGDGDDVVGVYVVEGKTHHTGARCTGGRAEHSEAGKLVERGAGERTEVVVVGADGGAADGVDVIAGGGEGDGVSDVGRAGFEALGGGFPSGAGELDVFYHAPAALPGWHGVEQGAAAVEHADAGGTAHFVAGKGEEIAAEGLHVEGLVADGLGGVYEGDGTDGAGAGAKLDGGVDDAEGVGDVGESEEAGARGEELVEAGEVEAVFGVGTGDGEVAHDGAGAGGGKLPRHEVRVVLHLGEEDFVAGAKIGGAPRLRDEVDGFCGASGEDDLGRVGGVDKLGKAGAGMLVGLGGAHGKRVQAAVDVGVVVGVVGVERGDDLAGFLGSSSAIEIDEGLAITNWSRTGKSGRVSEPGRMRPE